MSFLAPLFLLGALAVALPILFHLIRRTTRDRIPFSSLMFLLPSPPRLTRRSRLQNLFLLLLRCLVFSLLALGFARPFLPKPEATAPVSHAGTRSVLLLDTSASMRRLDLWPDTLAQTESWLKKAGPADLVAILTFDHQVQTIVSFDQWSSLPPSDRLPMARQKLQLLQPTWADTRLGNAILAALETFEALTPAAPQNSPRQIIVLTDSQAGAQLDGLQGLDWPPGVRVILEPIPPRHPGNATLQIIPEQSNPPHHHITPSLKVRLSNTAQSTNDRFLIHWVTRQDQILNQPGLDAYVPPGQSRVLTLPFPTNQNLLSHLLLSGDNEDFDNRAHFVPERTDTRLIFFLGPDSATDPSGLLYYLHRVFQDVPGQKTVILAHPSAQPLPPTETAQARFMILAAEPASQNLPVIRRFLDAGKTILLILRAPSDANILSSLLQSGPPQAHEAQLHQYTMLGQLDFAHPLLAPFSDPRFSDFTKIHFWKYRRLDTNSLPTAHPVARFENGDPALLQIPAGPGHLFVLTSGWHPADSQLALSSKFPPLLYSLAEFSNPLHSPQNLFRVGDHVPIPPAPQTTTMTVRLPQGPSITLPTGEPFAKTDQPGIYTVTPLTPPFQFAVDLNPAESQTDPRPIEELERLGLPLQTTPTSLSELSQPQQQHLQATELENHQKLWRWLILAALSLALVESWLAGHLSKPTTTQSH